MGGDDNKVVKDCSDGDGGAIPGATTTRGYGHRGNIKGNNYY
jgi:hypothetical protein